MVSSGIPRWKIIVGILIIGIVIAAVAVFYVINKTVNDEDFGYDTEKGLEESLKKDFGAGDDEIDDEEGVISGNGAGRSSGGGGGSGSGGGSIGIAGSGDDDVEGGRETEDIGLGPLGYCIDLDGGKSLQEQSLEASKAVLIYEECEESEIGEDDCVIVYEEKDECDGERLLEKTCNEGEILNTEISCQNGCSERRCL